MRPLVEIHHLARATRCARSFNPTITSARRFASAHSTSPQTNSGVAGHSAESYSKEVDSTPPADSSTYQVDEFSDQVQRPHQPPSGKFSQAGATAGVTSEAYRTVDKGESKGPPLEGEAGNKSRYGGKRSWSSEKAEEMSRAHEGPEGLSAGGRKPGEARKGE